MTRAPSRRGAGEWRRVSIFGLVLATDFPLANRLEDAAGPPDLRFTCASEAPLPVSWQRLTPIFESPLRAADGSSVTTLFRLEDCEVLRFRRSVDFYLWPERIVAHLIDPAHAHEVEIRLLGTALSYWLERRGIAALHAAAVDVEGRAVAFLSGNRGGKTSLAATLMQAGHALITDDLLAVERLGDGFLARPGYPQMRMWPEEAAHFTGGYVDLATVHPELTKRRVPVGAGGFGSFCDASRPLERIYLPRRRPPAEGRSEVEITPRSPRDAVIDLVRHSFSPFVVEATGLQDGRLTFFSRLVERVPVCALDYPAGYDRLPRVARGVLRDLGRGPDGRG